MEARFNLAKSAPGTLQAMLDLSRHVHESGLSAPLLNLVFLRASQINGCAWCIDMHWKDLRAEGETEQRLYSLHAWKESPFYSAKERAALLWTEAVTLLHEGHVPDDVYQEARAQFNEKDLSELTLAVVVINGWNRLNIASRNIPGDYQPAKRAAEKLALSA